MEFYAYGNDEQPAETFILGLSDEDAGRLFGFVDNIASDWPLRRPEGTDWKPLGGPATRCHEVRLRIWKTLHRLFVGWTVSDGASFCSTERRSVSTNGCRMRSISAWAASAATT